MKLRVLTRRLPLRHAWTIARGTALEKEYCFVECERDGVIGHGEAAHNARYGESLDGVRGFLERAAPVLAEADPRRYHDLAKTLAALGPGQASAKAALDMAALDWVAKSLAVPLHRLWGLNPERAPATSHSIAIADAAEMSERVAEIEDFPTLKIKLGGDNDAAILAAIRGATGKPLRVDANEGWKDLATARERFHLLLDHGPIELVEQPLPAGRWEEVLALRSEFGLTVVADEEVLTARDLPKLAGVYDGVNLKVMKAGGLQETLRMIHVARALGLRIMLGCMIESSLGITAAAQLGSLVDWLDLDGALLLARDPFVGARFEKGRPILPDAPGLGARPI